MPSETSSLLLSLCSLPFFVLAIVPLVQSCLLLKSGKYAVVIYGHVASNQCCLGWIPGIFHAIIILSWFENSVTANLPLVETHIWCGRATPHRCTASQGERKTENSEFQKLSLSDFRSQTLLFFVGHLHRQQSWIANTTSQPAQQMGSREATSQAILPNCEPTPGNIWDLSMKNL